MPVMSFIQEDDPWVLAYFSQNELRYVEAGNEAEIFLKTYPGRIIKCKVDSILWATAQGQMPIGGTLQTSTPGSGLDQRIAVRLLVEPRDRELFLATGAVGAGAIYTEEGRSFTSSARSSSAFRRRWTGSSGSFTRPHPI
jgi:multidrug resistance efflux pump